MENKMKIKIACLEDEKPQAEALKDKLICWGEKKEHNILVDIFDSAENFLFEMNGREKIPYDLLMLDISMGDMDGFSLAETIRKKDKKIRIIFLTSDPGRVFDGYEVDAWRYLLKPIDEEKINSFMSELAGDIENKGTAYVLMDVKGENVRIDTSELKYIEADGHYTNVVTSAETYSIHSNYNDVCKKFMKQCQILELTECRRGISVNVDKMESIGREKLVLEDGTILPVSRGMYKSVNEAFIKANLKS